MEEDPEKRFHSIMDKLLNAPSSKSISNPRFSFAFFAISHFISVCLFIDYLNFD
jgi:hypothetical protein